MPVYEYTALDIKGKTISGIIDADSSRTARQKLRASKTYPVSIEEVHDTAAIKAPKTFSVLRPFTRVRPQEISMMTRQLATLLGAGLPLVPAIDALTSQTRSKSFKKMLAKIKDSIVEGNSFARSLSLFPGTFSALYVNMVMAGETSGALEIVLERLADITEKQQALKSRIRSAMAYPILMSLIGVLVLFLLLTVIVPNITSIFSEMGQTLPAPTLFLIRISDIFKMYWWIILIGIAGSVIILRRINKTVKGRYVFDKIKLLLPRLGLLAKKLDVARFSRTLSTTFAAGIPLVDALISAAGASGNYFYRTAITNVRTEVMAGMQMFMAMKSTNAFPDMVTQMVMIGEESGDLDGMLSKVSDIYEQQVDDAVDALTSLLEPMIMVVLGVVVGGLIVAMYLPIFKIATVM
jgi:general secretion pathway protein F